MRRRQNEMVFKAWLQKKKEQVQQEKRIRRAKLLEEQSIKVRSPLCELGSIVLLLNRKTKF